MPPRRRVSVRQMEVLLEFAESNRDVALGRFPGGPQAVQATRQLWDSVTLRLNCIADGSTKTADQWRRYWIDYKAKTKNKAADCRRNASATGGGPNKLNPLDEIEKRVLAIIGPVAVEGLHGVRLPIDIPSADASQPDIVDSGIAVPNPSTSTTILQSAQSNPRMEEEWLEDEAEVELQHTVTESQTFTPPPSDPTTQNISEHPEVVPRENGPSPRSTAPTRRSRSRRHFPAGERAPHWAYDIESRRVAAEERHAAAMEGLLDVMKDILQTLRDNRHGPR